jgi:hypothetical protein
MAVLSYGCTAARPGAPPRPAARCCCLLQAMAAQLRLLAALLWPLPLSSAAALPHVVLLIGDDLGWANAGWNSAYAADGGSSGGSIASATPHLDGLAARGTVLHRMYGFHYCSPSRSALLSGRLPAHVFDGPPTMPLNVVNQTNPDSGQYGVPVSMTTLPKALAATHEAHHVGKWDIGHARSSLTPTGRGFLSSFGYLGGENDYWTAAGCPYTCCKKLKGGGKDPLVLDHWQDGHAADRSGVGPAKCTNQVSCNVSDAVYLESQFVARAVDIIAKHAAARVTFATKKSLFLYYASHAPHAPLQAPADAIAQFASIESKNRRIYTAQVKMLDDAVGTIVSTLRTRRMYNDSLIIFSTCSDQCLATDLQLWLQWSCFSWVLMTGAGSDNGGPTFAGGPPSANNFPLLGSKLSDWEGGEECLLSLKCLMKLDALARQARDILSANGELYLRGVSHRDQTGCADRWWLV